jgi:C-terminal processing protease CtpA/Prc
MGSSITTGNVKSNRIATILSVLFILITTFSFAQDSTKENRISPEKLKQDFQILRASLTEGYPAMYRYNSKKIIDALFVSSERLLQKPMSEREFLLFLSKVVMQFHDGHMKVDPAKATADKLNSNPSAIPIQAFISDHKMYVQKNYSMLSDKELMGAEILSINGRNISSIITDFFKIYTSDGNNETNKFKRLENTRSLSRYLFYLQGYTEEYEIEYVSFNEKLKKKFTLKGLLYDSLVKIRKQKYPAFQQSPAEFKLLNSSTAYLKIASLDENDYDKSKMDFYSFLRSSFDSINSKGIKNLILDMRGNGGGTDEYGKTLFSYFVDHAFLYYDSLTINKATFSFMKYTNHPNAKVPEQGIRLNSSGTYDVLAHPNVGNQQKSEPNYSGRLFVLIDGSCFSTTSECLSMLKSYTSAVFIGEESGGGYYGNCSGFVSELILPNSLLQIEIPLMKYSMAVKKYKYKDRGIIPDHSISPTIKDKISGVDPELDFTKKLVN